MTTSSRHCAVKPLRLRAEVRLYGRQFSKDHPNAGGKTLLQSLNRNSLIVVTSHVEPSLAKAQSDQKFLLEEFGYFVTDRGDHVAGKKQVFNWAKGLQDS